MITTRGRSIASTAVVFQFVTRTRAPGLSTHARPGSLSPAENASSLRPTPQPYVGYDAIRRALDITLASLLLLATLPLILAAALATLVVLRANPLLRQVRTGYLGREFVMLKLRTMLPPDN